MLVSDRPWLAATKSNDLAVLALVPFVKSSIVSGDDALQDVRRNNEINFNGVNRFDCDEIVADFDIWRGLTKISWSHVSVSPLFKTTEQAGGIKGRLTDSGKPLISLNFGKPVSLPAVVAVALHLAVASPTQVAA